MSAHEKFPTPQISKRHLELLCHHQCARVWNKCTHINSNLFKQPTPSVWLPALEMFKETVCATHCSQVKFVREYGNCFTWPGNSVYLFDLVCGWSFYFCQISGFMVWKYKMAKFLRLLYIGFSCWSFSLTSCSVDDHDSLAHYIPHILWCDTAVPGSVSSFFLYLLPAGRQIHISY